VIYQHQIPELISLFRTRGVCLYHACQLSDLHSYLRLGGVPSRALLDQSGFPFTAFETDSQDRNNGVWDKVFVNLSDFGRQFAHGSKGVPNPYGPILLEMDPGALHEATDVAVCVHSAAGTQFDRKREALSSLEEIDGLFVHPAAAGLPLSSYVKYRDQLRQRYSAAADPELSCSVEQGYLSMQHVKRVIVDPYRLGDKRLIDYVNMVCAGVRADLIVRERVSASSARVAMYTELGSLVMEGVLSLHELPVDRTLSHELRTWLQAILSGNPFLLQQFRRFAGYLRDGTLLPVRAGSI
jgi:hypothetical protein